MVAYASVFFRKHRIRRQSTHLFRLHSEPHRPPDWVLDHPQRVPLSLTDCLHVHIPRLWQPQRDESQQQRHERGLLECVALLADERLPPELRFVRSQSSLQRQSVLRVPRQGGAVTCLFVLTDNKTTFSKQQRTKSADRRGALMRGERLYNIK